MSSPTSQIDWMGIIFYKYNTHSYSYAPYKSVRMQTINISKRERSQSTHKVPKRRRLAPSWDVVDDRPPHQLVHGEMVARLCGSASKPLLVDTRWSIIPYVDFFLWKNQIGRERMLWAPCLNIFISSIDHEITLLTAHAIRVFTYVFITSGRALVGSNETIKTGDAA